VSGGHSETDSSALPTQQQPRGQLSTHVPPAPMHSKYGLQTPSLHLYMAVYDQRFKTVFTSSRNVAEQLVTLTPKWSYKYAQACFSRVDPGRDSAFSL